MRQLDGPTRDSLLAQQTSNVFIHCLEVTIYNNDDTTTNLYYCDQYVPITSNTKTYQPASFAVSLGEDIKDKMPSVNLSFDSGDLQIIRALREMNKSPDIKIFVITSDNLDYVAIGPIVFKIEQWTAKSSQLMMKLAVEPVLSEPVPSAKFTPTLFPQLWGSIT